jgi:hypothetical protein
MAPSKTIPWRKDGILEGSIQDTGSTGDVSFKVNGSSSEKITVNYGDGTSETKSLNNGSFSHTYPANSGPFRITVSGALSKVESIENLPRFELKGLIHTPLLKTLLVQNSSAVGDIKFFQFAPDMEKLSLLGASEVKGSIDVFQKMNGQLGKNGSICRILSADIFGDVNNFTAIASTATRINFSKNNLI